LEDRLKKNLGTILGTIGHPEVKKDKDDKNYQAGKRLKELRL